MMNARGGWLLLGAVLLIAACASTQPPVQLPTEAEEQACEAQGGSIQPAYAIHAYVCLLPPKDPGHGAEPPRTGS